MKCGSIPHPGDLRYDEHQPSPGGERLSMSTEKNPDAAPVDGIVTRDLGSSFGLMPFDLQLKPGMAWCLYSDEGPNGPCGQSMDTTCPHAYLAIWPNEDSMRAAMESGKAGRGGKRERVMWGVVGEWTTGKFTVSVYG